MPLSYLLPTRTVCDRNRRGKRIQRVLRTLIRIRETLLKGFGAWLVMNASYSLCNELSRYVLLSDWAFCKCFAHCGWVGFGELCAAIVCANHALLVAGFSSNTRIPRVTAFRMRIMVYSRRRLASSSCQEESILSLGNDQFYR